MSKRIPKYVKEENNVVEKPKKIHVCISCGDLIEIGNMKGKFNCPACGWENEIK